MPRILALLLLLTTLIPLPIATADDAKINVLIVDGQNNHTDWPLTTAMMREFLTDSGHFNVDVERTQYTWQGGELLDQYPLDDGKTYEELPQPKTDPDFRPDFADYDVVISNFGWRAASWPESTKSDFEDYIKNGGGLVVVHAADNSFPDWDAFNRMIGLGGWGGRDQSSGPYVYYNDDGDQIRDPSAGVGGAHGPMRPYAVVAREPDHPILEGLPKIWMHTKDELYQQLRGPADNMTILATAYADADKGGTGRHEPVLMTVQYGDGRIFHTIMGHDRNSFACVGFQTTLLRGTQWAATGKVTQTDVPEDFPTAKNPRSRNLQLTPN